MIRPGVRRALEIAFRRRRAVERGIDDELQLHLELRVARLIERGWSPGGARDEALRRFGPIDETRDDLLRVATSMERRMRLRDLFDDARQDAAHALRRLRRAPLFSIGVMATLALGIGANATMFGIVDRLLLRPPAYVVAPEHLGTLAVTFRGRGGDYTQDVLSYPIYRDLANVDRTFSDVAAYTFSSITQGRGADARELRGMRATASYFTALGVTPLYGRFFARAETDGAPGAPVAVLGYGFWQRQFAGHADVLGTTLELAGAKFTVIGIAPPGFTGLSDTEIDVWIPLSAGWTPADLQRNESQRQAYWLFVFARPLPGVSLTSAAQRATASMRIGEAQSGLSAERIAERQSRANFISALPRDARATSADAKVAVLIACVSLLVLILACANVANLQLMHATRRRQEIAVRLALGVSRRRLLSQLVLDNLFLALGGGVAALAVVNWGGAAIRRLLLDEDTLGSSVDGRVLAYTAAAALITGLITGLWPALRASRLELADALKSSGRSSSSRRSPTRTTLLVTQAALATVLLIGTGTFVLSVRRIRAVPVGMEPSHVNIVMMDVEGRTITDREVADATLRLEAAARAFPGVTATAATAYLPFYTSWGARVTLPGRDSVPVTKDGGPYINAVGPQFFDAVGTRILMGRAFTPADRAATPAVAVVNSTTARLWWPGENPIGKCFHVGSDTMPCTEVVGVAENARRQNLLEDESVQFFIPIGQGQTRATARYLFVRSATEAERISHALQRHLQRSAADLPYVSVQPLSELIDPQTRSWRLGATVFAAFGALALVLASIGMYAALAYDVAQRTREFGVRVALGAQRGEIARLIVGRGMAIVVAGFAIGFVLVLFTARSVEPLLFHTVAYEPRVVVAVALTLVAGALISTVTPARRATRVDPSRALSAE